MENKEIIKDLMQDVSFIKTKTDRVLSLIFKSTQTDGLNIGYQLATLEKAVESLYIKLVNLSDGN